MSGLEIAGIIIGVLPLLYKSAKDLSAVFRGVKVRSGPIEFCNE